MKISSLRPTANLASWRFDCTSSASTGRSLATPDGSATVGMDITLDDSAFSDVHTSIPMSGGSVPGIYQPDGRITDPLLVLNTDSGPSDEIGWLAAVSPDEGDRGRRPGRAGGRGTNRAGDVGGLKFRPRRATLRFPDHGGSIPKAACCLHA